MRGVGNGALASALETVSREFETRGYTPFVCVSSLSEADPRQQLLEWRAKTVRMVGSVWRDTNFWILRVLATTNVSQMAPYTCRAKSNGTPT
jgi:hypothetical protein